jgi:hypothetical protein
MPTITFDVDLNKDAFTADVSAPWGDFKYEGSLSFIRQCIAQLEWFLSQSQSPNPEHTKFDIEGYKQILATEREDLADLFLKTKDDARRKHEYFENNIAIIDFLKKEGKWD